MAQHVGKEVAILCTGKIVNRSKHNQWMFQVAFKQTVPKSPPALAEKASE
jgi:hypothetical protein